MTYIIDLTTVLKSLFEVLTPARIPRSSAGITWSELKEAFEAYENLGSRQRIHRRVFQIFQQDQQISKDSFGLIFRELAEDAKVPAPVATSNPVQVATSNLAPVVASKSNPAPVATSTPAPGVTSSLTQGATSESASGQPRRRRKRCPWLCA